MISKAAFKHSNRYAATASKYESVIERSVGPPRGPSKSSGKSGGNKPGPWDGVKPDAKSRASAGRGMRRRTRCWKGLPRRGARERERTSSITATYARAKTSDHPERIEPANPRNCPTRVADPRRAPSSTQIFCCIVVLACMYCVTWRARATPPETTQTTLLRPPRRAWMSTTTPPSSRQVILRGRLNPNREETEALTSLPAPEVFQSPENHAYIRGDGDQGQGRARPRRDATIEEPSTRAKVRMFADAIAGVKVRLVESEIAAVDDNRVRRSSSYICPGRRGAR